MDFTQYEESQDEVPVDKLEAIAYWISSWESKQNELSNLEEEVKTVKREIEEIIRRKIPQVLSEANMSSFVKSNGEKVSVEDKVHASIKKGTERDAYYAMIRAESTDPNCPEDLAEKIINSLWKNQVIAEDLTSEQKQVLIDHNIPFEPKFTIHNATLKKWAKQAMERGLTLGKEISVFAYQEAKVSK